MNQFNDRQERMKRFLTKTHQSFLNSLILADKLNIDESGVLAGPIKEDNEMTQRQADQDR